MPSLEENRRALLTTLFVAFPLGSTTERIELYVRSTFNETLIDLADAIERLIRTHQTTRAPSVAQVLDACREARRQRLEETEQHRRRLPATGHEQASAEDVQRLRALGAAGLFWNSRLGMFHAMTPDDLGRDLARGGGIPCHRADVNAAWLKLEKGAAKVRLFGDDATTREAAPF